MNLEERWDDLLSYALEIGLSLEAFWHLTPRELRLATRAYSRRWKREALFVAWHTAALTRMQRMPSLESLLAEPPTEEELRIEREEAERMHREMIAAHERAVASRAKTDG